MLEVVTLLPLQNASKSAGCPFCLSAVTARRVYQGHFAVGQSFKNLLRSRNSRMRLKPYLIDQEIEASRLRAPSCKSPEVVPRSN